VADPNDRCDVIGSCPGQKFPESCLRGLRRKDFVLLTGGVRSISGAAFADDTLQEEGWCKGWRETSINWEDPEALEFTRRARTKAGDPQALFGIARLSVEVIEKYLTGRPEREVLVKYERRPTKDNTFHGNILFNPSLEKVRHRQIAGILAEEAVWLEGKPEKGPE
jgi:hypothetical protein